MDADASGIVLNLDTSVVRRRKKSAPIHGSGEKRTAEGEDGGRKRVADDAVEDSRRQQTPRKRGRYCSLFDQHEIEIPDVKVTDTRSEPVFSSSQFAEFDLHPHLVACLRDRFGISRATAVQKMTIPVLLKRRDALVKSHTGSGKTLAYALPLVHCLQEIRPKLSRADGIRAVVIVPTRELALQTYECFEKLTKACTWIVPGVLMGGEKKKSEKARIRKGLTVVVGTPGRLIDHLERTESFTLRKASWLVVDEADRMLELGFEESVSKIVGLWKERREVSDATSVLLSATLTKGVEKLAGLALTDPTTLDVAVGSGATELEEFVLPAGLSQFYVPVPVKLSLMTLACLLIEACGTDEGRGKAIVFVAAQDIVDHHQAVFNAVLGTMLEDANRSVHFFKLHGEMSQHDRAEVFGKFREAPAGVLFTTDVAARGLDVPRVDLIVQCCVPPRPEDYVHRVGRTARIGAKGRAVTMLLPSEVGFLKVLAERRISPEGLPISDVLSNVLVLREQIVDVRIEAGGKLESTEDLVTALQLIFERETNEDEDLLEMAKKAYLSHVRSYASYPKAMREVVRFKALHLGHLAKAYCLRETPKALGSGHPTAPKVGPAERRAARRTKPRFDAKRLEVSEFDSGIVKGKGKKRKKGKSVGRR